MRVLTWNTNGRKADCLLTCIRRWQPHVVLLQEVRESTRERLIEGLRDLSCRHTHYSPATGQRNAFGNLTASHWPLTRNKWALGTHWPQLALRATVHTGSADVETINVHVPNGSQHGWGKVKFLEMLARALKSSDHTPRLLAGDFNEPQAILRDGTVVSFGERIDPDRSVRLWRNGSRSGWFTDRSGHADDLQRWADAVRRIFDVGAPHGLRHVRNLRRGAPSPVTHVVGDDSTRFFDHLFLSRQLDVTSHRYVHWVRENGYSDHSALYADLMLIR